MPTLKEAHDNDALLSTVLSLAGVQFILTSKVVGGGGTGVSISAAANGEYVVDLNNFVGTLRVKKRSSSSANNERDITTGTNNLEDLHVEESSGRKRSAAAAAASTTANNNVDESDEQSTKKRKYVRGVLVDIPSIGGITVKTELERLINEGRLMLPWEGDYLPKEALYNATTSGFIGVNQDFHIAGDGKRYSRAMAIIAMSMTPEQWNGVQRYRRIDITEGRAEALLQDIESQAMDTIYNLEMETRLRDEGSMCKAKASLHSIGCRMTKVEQLWKKNGKSNEEISNILLDRCRGEEGGLPRDDDGDVDQIEGDFQETDA